MASKFAVQAAGLSSREPIKRQALDLTGGDMRGRAVRPGAKGKTVKFLCDGSGQPLVKEYSLPGDRLVLSLGADSMCASSVASSSKVQDSGQLLRIKDMVVLFLAPVRLSSGSGYAQYFEGPLDFRKRMDDAALVSDEASAEGDFSSLTQAALQIEHDFLFKGLGPQEVAYLKQIPFFARNPVFLACIAKPPFQGKSPEDCEIATWFAGDNPLERQKPCFRTVVDMKGLVLQSPGKTEVYEKSVQYHYDGRGATEHVLAAKIIPAQYEPLEKVLVCELDVIHQKMQEFIEGAAKEGLEESVMTERLLTEFRAALDYAFEEGFISPEEFHDKFVQMFALLPKPAQAQLMETFIYLGSQDAGFIADPNLWFSPFPYLAEAYGKELSEVQQVEMLKRLRASMQYAVQYSLSTLNKTPEEVEEGIKKDLRFCLSKVQSLREALHQEVSKVSSLRAELKAALRAEPTDEQIECAGGIEKFLQPQRFVVKRFVGPRGMPVTLRVAAAGAKTPVAMARKLERETRLMLKMCYVKLNGLLSQMHDLHRVISLARAKAEKTGVLNDWLDLAALREANPSEARDKLLAIFNPDFLKELEAKTKDLCDLSSSRAPNSDAELKALFLGCLNTVEMACETFESAEAVKKISAVVDGMEAAKESVTATAVELHGAFERCLMLFEGSMAALEGGRKGALASSLLSRAVRCLPQEEDVYLVVWNTKLVGMRACGKDYGKQHVHSPVTSLRGKVGVLKSTMTTLARKPQEDFLAVHDLATRAALLEARVSDESLSSTERMLAWLRLGRLTHSELCTEAEMVERVTASYETLPKSVRNAFERRVWEVSGSPCGQDVSEELLYGQELVSMPFHPDVVHARNLCYLDLHKTAAATVEDLKYYQDANPS